MAKKEPESVPVDKAPRVMIYDIDRGLASLAPDAQIEKVFGYKPRRFITTQKFLRLFNDLHEASTIVTTDVLGDIEEQVYKVRGDIQIEVLDSLTAYQGQIKKEVKGEAAKLSLPMWGEIGESMEDLVYLLARTNSHVIILGHVKPEKDDDAGVIRYIPALSGRMQYEISRSFDLVLYTAVNVDKTSGSRDFVWQVIADNRRSAKCRLEEISKLAAVNGGFLPQDFSKLFEALAPGRGPLKILILGESGTGKTYSLRTLKKVKL